MSVIDDIKYMKIKIDPNMYIPKKLEDEYASVYMFTNENIKEYLSTANIEKGRKALSVLASGDHVFNLLHQGVLDIDTFDINKFTEYYALGIKRTMLEKYDYETFLLTYEIIKDSSIGYEQIAEIISDLIPEMEQKYREFWQETLNYYHQNQHYDNGRPFNLFSHFLVGWLDFADKTDGNIYLENSDAYSKAKEALSKANITFKSTNALDLSKTFNKKYDYLFLSNILDYVYPNFGNQWEIDKLNAYIADLETIMNDKGIIFLHYYFSKYPKKPIFNSRILFDELTNYDILNFMDLKNESSDAMILKRINKEIPDGTRNLRD